jgi:hypothetical protein
VTITAHPDLIRKKLKIPDGLSNIVGIALGYADTEHPQIKTSRKRLTPKGKT